MRKTLSKIAGLGISGALTFYPVAKAEDLMENILREESIQALVEEPIEAEFSPMVYVVPKMPIELPPPLYVRGDSIDYKSLPNVDGLKSVEVIVGNDFVKIYEDKGRKFHFVYCAKVPYPKGEFENTLPENFSPRISFYAEKMENGRFQNHPVTVNGREHISNCDLPKLREETPETKTISI